MKLEFTKKDMTKIKSILFRYRIHTQGPNYDDFVSNIMLEFALVLKNHPDIEVNNSFKYLLMERSIFTTLAKLNAKKRRNIHSASHWMEGDDHGLMAVPSTVDARIDAQRTYDLLPERAKEVVVSRIMGNSDAEFAAEKNVSRQGVWVNMRRDTKKVKKELK